MLFVLVGLLSLNYDAEESPVTDEEEQPLSQEELRERITQRVSAKAQRLNEFMVHYIMM